MPEITKRSLNKRSLLWDVFKGFGISFIVFGHTGKTGGAIVYLFHLALFFFVTGYFFNEEKFGDHPFSYFGRRLGSTWPRYILYCIFFALTHNYCVVHGLMPAGAVMYGKTEFISSVVNSMVMERPELYAGPMWFVPLWLLGGALFAGIVKFGRHFDASNAGILENSDADEARESGDADGAQEMSGTEGVSNILRDTGSLEVITREKQGGKQRERFLRRKNLIMLFLSLVCIAIGLYCVDVSLSAPYHMELAFVIEPFFAMGYFMKKYSGDWQERLPWFLMAAAAVVIFYLFTRFIAAGIWFDLASQYIFGLWYYVGGVLGIIFTILISELLLLVKIPGIRNLQDDVKFGDEVGNKSKFSVMRDTLGIVRGISQNTNVLAGLMALIGRYSFDIMALHIFVFKMIDMVLRKFYYRDPGMDISAYPSPLSQRWWMLYLVAAVIVPLAVGIIIDSIGGFIRRLRK